MRWNVEEMPIYRDAVRFVALAEAEEARVARVRSDIADNLRRSSTSALFNLREALHEFAPLEKARVLRIMQRETGECCAAFDAIIVLNMHQDETHIAKELGLSLIRQAGGLGRAAMKRRETKGSVSRRPKKEEAG